MSTTETPATPSPSHEPHRSVWSKLYHGETTWDFVGRRRIGFLVSGIALLITLVALIFSGLNLGLDFKGGVAWNAPQKNGINAEAAKAILAANGIDEVDAKIQTLNATDGSRLRIQVGAQPRDKQDAVRQALATKAGVDVQEVAVDSVSATWGSEITKKAVTALIVFFILLFIYISFRFEWKMAIGAIAAVVHDLLISVGVYAVLRFPVTPATVIAFLTILGFSLYDTIVVYDKVDENVKKLSGGGRYTYGDIVNLSMNQVFMRSINTSLAAVLPVLSLLLVGSLALGAVALQDFALALLVGLITGSYSSIFIATPVLAWLKERFEPKWGNLREKLGAATGEMAAARMAMAGSSAASRARAAAAGTADGAEAPIPTPLGGVGGTGLSHPPRPRKKRR